MACKRFLGTLQSGTFDRDAGKSDFAQTAKRDKIRKLGLIVKKEKKKKEKNRSVDRMERLNRETRGELFFLIFLRACTCPDGTTECPLHCGRRSLCDRGWAEKREWSYGEWGIAGCGDEMRRENRKTKPFRRRLGNGLDRWWSRNTIFLRMELLIAMVQHQNVDAIHFPIFRAAGIKRLRSRDS